MSHTHNAFDQAATEYDAWFDSESGQIIFKLEVDCLRNLMALAPGRWLEVGVGTGRFAVALGVPEGVDPTASMRVLAERRGIHTVDAVGEGLPYADRTFDGLLMTTTLCFLADPAIVLRECQRVLKDAGRLVVGLIPADSSWGRLYARKAAEGHPIYSAATFHTSDQVIGLAADAGFGFQEAWSCLLASPESFGDSEQPHKGIVPGAGFVAVAFTKQTKPHSYDEGL